MFASNKLFVPGPVALELVGQKSLPRPKKTDPWVFKEAEGLSGCIRPRLGSREPRPQLVVLEPTARVDMLFASSSFMTPKPLSTGLLPLLEEESFSKVSRGGSRRQSSCSLLPVGVFGGFRVDFS
jgi:hypothetical protein